MTRRAWLEAHLDCLPQSTIACELRSDHMIAILKHARDESRNGGREVCGLLMGRPSGHLDLRPLTNTAEGPSRWAIDPTELRAAWAELKRESCAYLGTYHSHVRGFPYPGEADRKGAGSVELMLILDANSGLLGLWRNPPKGIPGSWTAIPIWCSAIGISPQTAALYSRQLETQFRQKVRRARTWRPWWDLDEFSRGIRVLNAFSKLL